MGLLTATLLVFGRFSAEQELTAARASGVSLISLITPILLFSLLCCIISVWFNADLGPRSRVAYRQLRLELLNGLVNVQLPEGQPIDDFPGYIFYMEKNRGGNLENVFIIRPGNETNATYTVKAPRGRLETDPLNKKLILHLFDARTVTWSGTHNTTGSWPELSLNFDLNTATNRPEKPEYQRYDVLAVAG